jgi:hypothetical protein
MLSLVAWRIAKITSERKERKRKTGRGTWENDILGEQGKEGRWKQEKMGKAGKSKRKKRGPGAKLEDKPK